MINGDDEITNLKIMICNLDLSVETKEKLYNQAHKIRNQLQQKENIIKEVREGIERGYVVFCEQDKQCLLNFRENILKILDKASDKQMEI